MNIDSINCPYERLIVEAFDEVPQDYYKLKTTYSRAGIVRERVFCYEFYHRIRSLQESKLLTDLNIHGEVDKRGHELFEAGEQRIPDFIFHKPGSMRENLIVVEVKGKLEKNGLLSDWNTLSVFCKKYNYVKGMWIIYNYSLNDVKDKIYRYSSCLENIAIPRINLVCKKNCDSGVEMERLYKVLRELGRSGDEHSD